MAMMNMSGLCNATLDNIDYQHSWTSMHYFDLDQLTSLSTGTSPAMTEATQVISAITKQSSDISTTTFSSSETSNSALPDDNKLTAKVGLRKRWRKRSKASADIDSGTVVITADKCNFRALVQEYTGEPQRRSVRTKMDSKICKPTPKRLALNENLSAWLTTSDFSRDLAIAPPTCDFSFQPNSISLPSIPLHNSPSLLPTFCNGSASHKSFTVSSTALDPAAPNCDFSAEPNSISVPTIIPCHPVPLLEAHNSPSSLPTFGNDRITSRKTISDQEQTNLWFEQLVKELGLDSSDV